MVLAYAPTAYVMFRGGSDRKSRLSSFWQVRLFQDVEEGVKLAIYERLHRKQYVADTRLLRKGNPVKRMYFIIRGTLSCDDQPMLISFLNKKADEHQDNANQFCGEELLLWHLENSSKVDASGTFFFIHPCLGSRRTRYVGD